jgi:hypothetical protein
MDVLALLASPLLGPTVWRPVAQVLRRLGHTVALAPAARPARTPEQVVATTVEALPVGSRLVLVTHSNAGLYVPVLGRHREVVAHVFVDASLPPAAGSIPMASPALYAFLTGLADENGMLPPWSEWWEEDDVRALFPSAQARREVERDQSRLPLAYFGTTIEVHAGWDAAPSAYLAFGDTYSDERRAAAERGWPVRTMHGGHLHMLVDPEGVGAEIDALVSLLLRRDAVRRG